MKLEKQRKKDGIKNIASIDLIYCDILYGTGRKFTDYIDLKPNRKVIDDFYFLL